MTIIEMPTTDLTRLEDQAREYARASRADNTLRAEAVKRAMGRIGRDPAAYGGPPSGGSTASPPYES